MILTAENLSLAYTDANETVYAVREASFGLPKTGLHTIIGPSGSGKTSLLYLLSGIKAPTDGVIRFDGKALPATAKALSQLRRREMGFVFQMHFLINYLTVEENIFVGAPTLNRSVKMHAHQLMKRLGLEGLEKRKPYQLSGGQRQRVAIARAFIHRPKVVFVDEPTASLDKTSGSAVLKLLEEFAADACIVVVTHDDRILQHSTDAYEMRDGVLKALKI